MHHLKQRNNNNNNNNNNNRLLLLLFIIIIFNLTATWISDIKHFDYVHICVKYKTLDMLIHKKKSSQYKVCNNDNNNNSVLFSFKVLHMDVQ